MNMKKVALFAGVAAAMFATSENVPSDYRPPSRKQLSKSPTLTRKVWKKRKIRLRITKRSRQKNRA